MVILSSLNFLLYTVYLLPLSPIDTFRLLLYNLRCHISSVRWRHWINTTYHTTYVETLPFWTHIQLAFPHITITRCFSVTELEWPPVSTSNQIISFSNSLIYSTLVNMNITDLLLKHDVNIHYVNSLHAFIFISNTFISNTRLEFALCERQISENITNQSLWPMQNDCTHFK